MAGYNLNDASGNVLVTGNAVIETKNELKNFYKNVQKGFLEILKKYLDSF